MTNPDDLHWVEKARDYHRAPRWLPGNPLVGVLGEGDCGDLLLPAWRNPMPNHFPDGWWNRTLDLRNPLHWVPYLRSRLTHKVVMLDG